MTDPDILHRISFFHDAKERWGARSDNLDQTYSALTNRWRIPPLGEGLKELAGYGIKVNEALDAYVAAVRAASLSAQALADAVDGAGHAYIRLQTDQQDQIATLDQELDQ